MGDRPELAGLVLFAATLVLLRAGRGGSDRALVAVVAAIALWANVHGSFALGVILALLVCVEGALLDPGRRRSYVLCAVGAAVASLLTPSGIGAWTSPGYHLLSPPREIQEWGLVDPRTPLGVAYAVTLALVVARAFVPPRPPARELVVLLPVAALSLTAVRQAPLLAIAAAPLFADALARVLERMSRAVPASARATGPIVALAAAAIVNAAVVAPGAPDMRGYPISLGPSAIPTGDGTLARYEWGGWLIWSRVPVFIDGRFTPYVGSVLDDYRRVVAAGPGWTDVVARRGVRMLLVAPSDPVAARARELGWRVVASSDDAILIAVP